ncbi:FAD-binding oxidoreductase [Rhizobium sp. L1K21]|uniref:NAD(P)/FAD-dependent oxidoreductase n=1 Tax=Rhizobium sp. L1K21 TaxID=2954933 RepID=UPI0020938787|nr:FAD-binding oxidoreductase [Rhizobium sp. L1K21]MCO6185395.1 FAD-binding oxidoreductase [Rhizobium sp. L1K21]
MTALNQTPLEIAPLAENQRQTIAVIGAGFVGLCSALWLQRAGHKVTIIDPEPPTGNVSYRNACSYGNACTIAAHAVLPVGTPGIVWDVPRMLLRADAPLSIIWRYLPQLAPWLIAFLSASRTKEVERISSVLGQMLYHADAAWLPLMQQSESMHLRRENGCLYLYKSEADYRSAEQNDRLRAKYGVAIDEVSRDEIRDLEPNLAPVYERGALYRDSFNLWSPLQLAQALARAFEAAGGTFVRQEALNVEANETGGKVHTSGDPVEAGHIVIAAGAHSKRFCAQLGDKVLLDTERGYHVLFPEGRDLLNRPVCYPEHGFYMVPMQNGIRTVGTVEFGGLKRPLNPKRTAMLRNATPKLLPNVGTATDEWMGFRPSMPDSLPVIGPSPKSPNVTYAFGHGHIGLTLGALTGYLVAQNIAGQQTLIDVEPLRPVRF